MAGGGDSVMWLRVEDEEIDAAKLLRVAVTKSTTGSGKKRRTSCVCTGTLHKSKEERMGEYDHCCRGKLPPSMRPRHQGWRA